MRNRDGRVDTANANVRADVRTIRESPRPGYRQTEVGVIPEDWEVRKLGDISKIVRGGSPRPAGDPNYFNGDFIPWLTVAALTNIASSELIVSETFGFLTEEGAKFSRTLNVDTVIIANSGATLGVAKILGIKCCANDGIAALLNLCPEIDNKYITYYINTLTKRLREVVATGNGQPNLNTDLIGNTQIPLPPIKKEQTAIAAILSDTDALIDSLEKLIVKKLTIKYGAMQELLTGKKRLPGFSGKWEEKMLGEIGSFFKGKGIKKDDVINEGIPCIRYGEIYTTHDNYIKSFKSFINETIALESVELKKGDLLFAGSGETAEEIGKCVAFIDDEKAYAGGDIVILRPLPYYNSLFLGFLLNTSIITSQKARMGQGDAVVHISSKNLGEINVSIPPTFAETNRHCRRPLRHGRRDRCFRK